MEAGIRGSTGSGKGRSSGRGIFLLARQAVFDAFGEVMPFIVGIVDKQGEKNQYMRREEESTHHEAGVRGPPLHFLY